MEENNQILVKEEQLIPYYSTNKIDQQGNAIKYFQAMKIREGKKIGARKISKLIDMPEGAIAYWLLGNKPKSIHGLYQLKSMNLLPFIISNNISIRHFIHTLGLRYADGCIYEQKRNNSYTFYLCFGNKIDATNFILDTNKIWGTKLKKYFSSNAYYIYLPSSLARLSICLGSPIGDKTKQNFQLPTWIDRLPNNLKWEFISGLFSGDGSVPRLKQSKRSSESLKFSLSSEKSVVSKFSKSFMLDLWKFLNSLNINASKPKIQYNQPRLSKNGRVTYPIEMRILTKKQNMINFLENIKYRYNNKANTKTKEVLIGLNRKN